ncbi:TraR/DksA family transcriptional regulator [Streptomyces pinistramenti]|uniref:TraR/DksA family transcriptional regulator n=1 Tax=Streptomyces pinistramenti TaxID=2884812 RepID=UPI001D0820C2|nr:TraR/DksA C4-type zinc finger protein [Streptomyces pinistramenti]MCB5911105.1 TraR/DksA C4-type zinc finger protein [Streptomyces pinistramenti]
MSPEAAHADPRAERLTAHDARGRLAHERHSRLTQLAAIEESAPPGTDALLAVQTRAIRQVLAEIDAAVARLDAGTYGDCGRCAKPVPVERLEILPYARCCVGCQERTV